jgi:hypothetical protein
MISSVSALVDSTYLSRKWQPLPKAFFGNVSKLLRNPNELAVVIMLYGRVHFNTWATVHDLDKLAADTLLTRDELDRVLEDLEQRGLLEVKHLTRGNVSYNLKPFWSRIAKADNARIRS